MNYIQTINKYLKLLNDEQQEFILKIIKKLVKAE